MFKQLVEYQIVQRKHALKCQEKQGVGDGLGQVVGMFRGLGLTRSFLMS